MLFVLLLGCAFVLLVLLVISVLFVLLVRAKSFRKKKNKEFKTILMTSFTLLLVTFGSGEQKLVLEIWAQKSHQVTSPELASISTKKLILSKS